jgi:hypothetical protein
MTCSSMINLAISLALAEGNVLMEISTGWTEIRKVAQMRDPLSESLRSSLLGIPGLRFWTVRPTPHNRAEAGFTDDLERVSISFPMELT